MISTTVLAMTKNAAIKGLRDQELEVTLVDRDDYASSQAGEVEDVLDDDESAEKDSEEERLEREDLLAGRLSERGHSGCSARLAPLACAIWICGSASASIIAVRVICMVRAAVGIAIAIVGSAMLWRFPTRLVLIGHILGLVEGPEVLRPDEQEENASQEDGDREDAKKDDADRRVQDPIRVDSRNDAERHADERRQHDREKGELERDRELLG